MYSITVINYISGNIDISAIFIRTSEKVLGLTILLSLITFLIIPILVKRKEKFVNGNSQLYFD